MQNNITLINKKSNQKKEAKPELKHRLLDVGNDVIIIIASYIKGDKNIHNFISTCKNIYAQKDYVDFYGYYPISLNLILPFRSICAKISNKYQKELPDYIKRLEIVNDFPYRKINVEDVTVNIIRLTDNATYRNIIFGENVKKIFFKNYPSGTTFDLGKCKELSFIGLRTSTLKKIQRKKEGNIQNDGVEEEDDDDTNIIAIDNKININKINLNKDKITRLYLFFDDIKYTINNVNNLFTHFSNIKELIIDGQYKCFNKNGHYTFDSSELLNDDDFLYIPNGVKVCKIIPQILIKKYPKSLERLYLKNYIPINRDIEKRINIQKLDYIDEILLTHQGILYFYTLIRNN